MVNRRTKGKKIVVVENDEDMLFLLQNILSEAGYEVEVYKDGVSIIEGQAPSPDLYILDNQLPTISGVAICKYLRIKRATQEIPIIMISAYPLKYNLEDIKVDEFILKPFERNVFLKMVERCMQGQYKKSLKDV